MNQKKVVIAVVVLLLLALGVFFMMKKGGSNSAMNSDVQTGSNNSVFSSIQDALTKSLSLECTFKDEDGNETKSYLKAGAVRTDITGSSSNQSMSAIIKDKKMYSWNPTTKEGFMMTVPEVTPGQTNPETSSSDDKQAQNPGDIMATLEKFKDSCKATTVSDSLFTPPSDVTFKDYSSMMEDLQKMTQPSSGKMDENSIKEMMEKYGNQ